MKSQVKRLRIQTFRNNSIDQTLSNSFVLDNYKNQVKIWLFDEIVKGSIGVTVLDLVVKFLAMSADAYNAKYELKGCIIIEQTVEEK